MQWIALPKGIQSGHAPMREHGDAENLLHRRFEVFWGLVKWYKPRYLVHGRVHMNYAYNSVREHRYGQTVLINGYESNVLDLPEYDKWGKRIASAAEKEK